LTLLLTTETESGERLSEEQVEDQIMTFIAAGHETTSRALTWLSYLLSQDTKARARLEAEVDALDTSLPAEAWLDHIPFAMACFNEAMRLYPPAPFISRIAIKDDEFNGKVITKKSTILVNLWSLIAIGSIGNGLMLLTPNAFWVSALNPSAGFNFCPLASDTASVLGSVSRCRRLP